VKVHDNASPSSRQLVAAKTALEALPVVWTKCERFAVEPRPSAELPSRRA